MDSQLGLFIPRHDLTLPLPHRLRPERLADFIGYNELVGKNPFLDFPLLPSFIVWGPPGTGKTTLALALAKERDAAFFSFSAVMGNLADLKKLMDEAKDQSQIKGNRSIILIDEIHRFNKAQQDALLPRVEAGHFTLIGATTENPRYVINAALLSRCHLLELPKISENHLLAILQRALASEKVPPFPNELTTLLVTYSDGDARRLLNLVEAIVTSSLNIHEHGEQIKELVLKNCRDYDRQHNRHYDVISAFIKSMRGSDPDAALWWLAVMLDGGEDPVFIARRLMIFAAEDVGNADPWGILLAQATHEAVKAIGLPEARINLAQATSYLAATVKSNAAYKGINEAIAAVKQSSTPEVPDHLKNHLPGYLYPHDYPEHFVRQDYAGRQLPHFYRPTDQGREKMLKERLEKLWDR